VCRYHAMYSSLLGGVFLSYLPSRILHAFLVSSYLFDPYIYLKSKARIIFKRSVRTSNPRTVIVCFTLFMATYCGRSYHLCSPIKTGCNTIIWYFMIT
jgi:hypothetical protein